MSFKNVKGINWILLRIQSGAEDKTKKDLDAAIESLAADNEEDLFVKERLISIEVPKIAHFDLKNGVRKKEEKTAFSGYIFVKIEIQKDDNSEKAIIHILSFIRSILKRISIIRSGGEIKIINNNEYESMLRGLKETSEKRETSTEIQSGMFVEILTGPFCSTKGQIKSYNKETGDVKVSVILFGTENIVELKSGDIKLIDGQKKDEDAR